MHSMTTLSQVMGDVIVKCLSERGYIVVTANDGLKAMRLLSVEDVHPVLLYLRMPGADGVEVLRTATRINQKITVVNSLVQGLKKRY